VIHVALDEAVQLHSGCADTVMAFFPPAGSIELEGASSDTWHFTGDGPVDVLDSDPQPMVVMARASRSDDSRILRARERRGARLDRRG